MKHRTTRKTASNRIPPSIPKCVRRCSDGYTTDFITLADGRPAIKLLFKKTNSGYTVLKTTSNSPQWIEMSTNFTVAPATRALFSNLTTLKAAINAAETWLGHTLPEIR